MEPQIHDPVFALLVRLVSSGTYGALTGSRLEAEMERLKVNSKLPYRSLDSLIRLPSIPGRSARIKVTFHGDLDLPIPYSILGYHPGSFTASQTCVFREWIFPRLRVAYDEIQKDSPHPATVELQDVHLFGIEQGKVNINIDGWLDKLMGGALDDTGVTCLMLCRHNGEWLGFAMGYNKDGKGRSGALSFAKDEILFPTPSELRSVGPRLRAQEESLTARWAADSTRWAPSFPSLSRGRLEQ